MTVSTWTVAAEADDVSQIIGSTPTTTSWLIARRHNSQVGIASVQFNVTIPRGALLNSVRFFWQLSATDNVAADASEMVVGFENSLSPANLGTASPNRPLDRLNGGGTLGGLTTNGSTTWLDATWQLPNGTPVANAAAVAHNSVIYTPNIASLLQPLVNDPAWNSVDQRITVFCWGKDTNPNPVSVTPTSSTFGNGTSRFYQAGAAGVTVPSITVDYVLSGNTYTLNGLLGGSVSSGDGAIVDRDGPILLGAEGRSISAGRSALKVTGAPNPVVVLHNRRYDDTLVNGWIIPGLNADGDTVLSNALSGNPQVLPGDAALGPRIRNASQPLAPSGRSLRIESYINTGANVQYRFDTHSGAHRDYYTAPIGVYSARLYYRHDPGAGPAYGAVGMLPGVIRFTSGGVTSWGLNLDQASSAIPSLDTTSDRLRMFEGTTSNGTVIAGPTSTRLNSVTGRIWRYELQVDPNRTPKVQVRVYRNEETTPYVVLNGDPASVLADGLLLGVTGNQQFQMQHWADLEVHSNYDLSGEFPANPPTDIGSLTGVGAPYVAPKWKWWEVVGPNYEVKELDDLGLWDGTTVDNVPLTEEDDLRQITGVTYTSQTIQYAPGRNLTLHTPDGPIPEGGWPLLVWVHGGFFVAGTKDQLSDQMLEQILAMGWAVATVNYILSTPIATTSYPAYSVSSATGRFPSHAVDVKRAAYHLKINAYLYNLNGDRTTVAGFSAGGNIAMTAHVSRDLTATVNPLRNDPLLDDLTIYSSSPWAQVSASADPVFLGCYSWAGPVDMQIAVDGDEGVFPTATGNTNIVSGAKAFVGRGQSQSYDLTGTGVQDLIARQPPGTELGPIWYNAGTSDYLVKWWDQIPPLEAACAAAGVEFNFKTSYNTSHDNMNTEFDPEHLIAFLEQFGIQRLNSNEVYDSTYSDLYRSS